MKRPYNFSAGPAAIPDDVLQSAAAEMLNWHDSGMSVMEMSHRGKEFGQIYEEAQADLRELLAVPEHFKLLFMQGGGLGENAFVPMNLSRGETADFVVTGSWSQKSAKEAKRYCTVHEAANTESSGFTTLQNPATWQLSTKPAYVHICSNETIHGVEYHELPDLKALGCDAPLVMDCSSHIASRPVDWSRVGLAFAGAQKNLGPAGLTLVVVREDLLDRALPTTPSAFTYKTVADNQSMYNTPPTYAIYIAGLVFKWLKHQGGITAIEAQNLIKSTLLYDAIDRSSLYINRVEKQSRSRMNVPFFLRDERLNDTFLTDAKSRQLLHLKGHKSVGGMRASIYNAMPLQGVQALVSYLQDFEAQHA